MEDKKLELRLGPPGDDGNFYNNGGFVDQAKIGERKWMPHRHKSTSVLPNRSEKRVAEAAVVGWPPIRSFRKNLAIGSSSKAVATGGGSLNKLSKGISENENKLEKGLFVKINMDGVPIGRKIDLNAYDSYDTLSKAVDQLFRGLLAAQKNHSTTTTTKSHQKEKEEEETKGSCRGGPLGGSGEYTLVYEDNEGDRMLVGDVPWHMFVSTAKRLRVLKRSELSSLRGSQISTI